MLIRHAEGFIAKVKEFKNGRIPGLNANGYGKKISTRYMIKLPGSTRWLRVYQTQFSNNASLWVETKDGTFFVRDHQLQDIIRAA